MLDLEEFTDRKSLEAAIVHYDGETLAVLLDDVLTGRFPQHIEELEEHGIVGVAFLDGNGEPVAKKEGTAGVFDIVASKNIAIRFADHTPEQVREMAGYLAGELKPLGVYVVGATKVSYIMTPERPLDRQDLEVAL